MPDFVAGTRLSGLSHYGGSLWRKTRSRIKKSGSWCTNQFNEEKNKKCYFSFEERKRLLEAIRYVDLVIPEECWEQKRSDIEMYHVDTFVMGDDWSGKFDDLKDICDVVYLSRTPEISTTKIKKELKGKE